MKKEIQFFLHHDTSTKTLFIFKVSRIAKTLFEQIMGKKLIIFYERGTGEREPLHGKFLSFIFMDPSLKSFLKHGFLNKPIL